MLSATGKEERARRLQLRVIPQRPPGRDQQVIGLGQTVLEYEDAGECDPAPRGEAGDALRLLEVLSR
jgi:hypothetical protein